MNPEFLIFSIKRLFSKCYGSFAGEVFENGVKGRFTIESTLIANGFDGVFEFWLKQYLFYSFNAVGIYKLEKVFTDFHIQNLSNLWYLGKLMDSESKSIFRFGFK